MIRYLKSQEEYLDSRESLIKANLSFLNEKRSLIKRSLLTPKTGDILKSWDLELAISEIKKTFTTDAQIIDFGAYGSEIPWCLDRLGYRNIHGIDLNPDILNYPKSSINWVVDDYYKSQFEENSADCITAISVIEHGYDPIKLIREAHRLLKTSGKFIFSFDYWPTKIDTSKEYIFDMTWTILSKEEFETLVDLAQDYGFQLVGKEEELPSVPVISYNDRDYTFAFVVLEKVR
jgi:SAM-dependent methyltransferase